MHECMCMQNIYWSVRHCCNSVYLIPKIFGWIFKFLEKTNPENCLEVRDYNPTCFTDSSALPVWCVSRRLLVHTHQPFVALAQVVPLSTTGLPLQSGTDGAAAADARRHAAFALELERPPGGAVYPLAGWAVESLQPLSCHRGCFLWPRGPQHDTDKDEHPHPSPAIKMWWGHMLFFFIYIRVWAPGITLSLWATTSTPNGQPMDEGWGGFTGWVQSAVNYPLVLSSHYQQRDFVLK